MATNLSTNVYHSLNYQHRDHSIFTMSNTQELIDLTNVVMKPHSFKTPKPPTKPNNKRYKTLKQLITDELKYLQTKDIKFDTPTYNSISAPPSLKPAKHYCDITGLPSRYRAPSNGLRFHNVEIYQEVIKHMAPSLDQEYLGLRGANVVLK